MKKTKIYLDTSVINYVDAPHMPSQMKDTLDLWEVFVSGYRFEVMISGVVEREILASPETKRIVLLEKMSDIDYDVIPTTESVIQLANHYGEFGVLSPKSRDDLLHIAHATIGECQMIASWNFKHFVNYKTMDRVNAVNLMDGYNPIRIATPSMIMGELDNE